MKITVERPLRLNFAVTNDRLEKVISSSAYQGLVLSRKRKNKEAADKEILEGRAAQQAILDVLVGLKPAFAQGELVKDRALFDQLLGDAFDAANLTLDAGLKAALLAPGCLGERDPSAEVCWTKKGESEPDPELRDTENVPLPTDINLPLPLAYEGKKNKGKLPLQALVRQHCEDYLAREVLPYRDDAWIDHDKTKVGYEIPFNRHFYEYKPPRPLAEIEQDIEQLERDIMAMLKEITA